MAGLTLPRQARMSSSAPILRGVIWGRRRGVPTASESAQAQVPEGAPADRDPLEDVPLAALAVSPSMQVLRANAQARALFKAEGAPLPASLVELTRESRLEEAIRAELTGTDVRLVHHGRVVRIEILAGPDSSAGERTVFIHDLTELRRLQTVRQEFVANLSHELKTPLTSLRLAAESLEGDPPPEARKRFAERVVREADHLVAIVDNLRQLVEIEGGRINVRPARFDLRELIEEVSQRIQLDRPLNVEAPAGLSVIADRAKLAQALGNLLDNAAKFSPPGSAVDVSAESLGGEILIRVRDRGHGISPEHWERVFERFYKVDPARSREMAGSGLGLAITKHLVMAHGGRVWTEAHREGGQVFGLAIPAPGSITAP